MGVGCENTINRNRVNTSYLQEEINKLNVANDYLKESANKRELSFKELKNSKTALDLKLKEIKNSVFKIKSSLNSKDDELVKIHGEAHISKLFSGLKETTSKLNNNLSDYINANNNLEKEMIREIELLQNDIENLNSKIEKLQKDLSKYKNENINLKNQLKIKTNEVDDLQKKNQKLIKELNLIKNQNLSSTQTINDLTEKNQLLENNNNQLKEKNCELEKKVIDLEMKYDNKNNGNYFLETFNYQKENYNNFYKNDKPSNFIITQKNSNIYDNSEEKEKIKVIKNNVIENQKKLRLNVINNFFEGEDDQNINKELEDMCSYGIVMKKVIKMQKKQNPNWIISTYNALRLEKKDPGLFALGLIADNLEQMGIETLIDKTENKNEEDEAITCLQFISNGLNEKRKYELHFEFGEKRNEELLTNRNEYEKFKKNLILKLSRDYNIPTNKIIVTFPQKGSFWIQIIFQSDEFNNLDLEQFKQKFQNEKEFKELQLLKEVHTNVIMGACKLSKNQLDPRGNRKEGWGVGEKRGGKKYYPPIGWTGIGLKVWDKYENNTWIGMNNSPGEWCVAYHGVGNNKSSNEVKKITGLIYKGGFKKGPNQVHRNHSDQYHKGKIVGEGVYCTPNIKTAEGYAGISEINGKKYKTVLMVRVKPDLIRGCIDANDYWVVNGTNEEIRPYRILYKRK